MKLEEMDIFKESHKLAVDIYNVTKQFPEEDKFGLTSQMRRASVSIPSNLVEGNARYSENEYIYFLKVAIGSCSELKYQLYFSNEVGIMNESDYSRTSELCKKVLGMLISTKNKITELKDEK